MSDRRIVATGAVLGGLAVGLGAFGAHALRGLLDAQQLGWWETGVTYQMWHGLALLALSALPLPRKSAVALLLAAGALIFSGSLYVLALTRWLWLGAITPIGGAAMIAGWTLLAWEAFRRPD